jgi:NCS1 family nucleobase:cation symporter-1
VIALVPGVLPDLPGVLKTAGMIASATSLFETLHAYAWFIGLAIPAAAFSALMRCKACCKTRASVLPNL